MTIQEAIASNKPFKRTWWSADYWLLLIGWDVFIEREVKAQRAYHEAKGMSMLNTDIIWCMQHRIISIDDIMAEDWETKS